MSKWKEMREQEASIVEADNSQIEPLSLEETEKAFADIFAPDGELIAAIKREYEDANVVNHGEMETKYFVAACFTNNQQLNEFCSALRLNQDEQYMNGAQFIKRVRKVMSQKQ